ncbi:MULTISPECIES: hypothetical protein [unclassified Sulfitobacter]|uniref:hypothetical protein n=1 Tax=unclassified Sulfitobacter TaxID=196795 RepID=UPI001593F4FC|nr:hypothetical protein [Sulfitobacter sp. HGT1]
MTRFTAITAALLLTAGMASAQDTTAVAVGGETGIPGYPTSVIGANGVAYACGPLIGGVYNCVTAAGAGAGAGAGFGGIGAGGIAGMVAAVVAVAAIANSSNGTNGTN